MISHMTSLVPPRSPSCLLLSSLSAREASARPVSNTPQNEACEFSGLSMLSVQAPQPAAVAGVVFCFLWIRLRPAKITARSAGAQSESCFLLSRQIAPKW